MANVNVRPLYIVLGMVFVVWVASWWVFAPPEDGPHPQEQQARTSEDGRPLSDELMPVN
jgi:hypothetical protein